MKKIAVILLILSVFIMAFGIPNATSIGPAPQSAGNQIESMLNIPPSYGLVVAPTRLLKYVPEWKTISTMYHNRFYAGDFINNDFTKLYAIDFDLNYLYMIDVATGATTAIGPTIAYNNEYWVGISGSIDGVMYALSTSCMGNSTLYTLDLATGAATVIGSNTSPCIIDIAISPQGIMYGLDIWNDTLIQIDTETGASTTIGNVGFDANYAQDMDFDDVREILYLAAYNDGLRQGEMRIADVYTGYTELVGAFPRMGDGVQTELDAFAVARIVGSRYYLPLIANEN